MSEQINNRKYRQETIKQIISQLHQGKSVDEVKQKFEEAFKGVSATEISEAEQALISEGLPVSEVQKLCDVHAAVFKGSIEDIHKPVDIKNIPGHPANIIVEENMAIEDIVLSKIRPHINKNIAIEKLREGLQELRQVDIHYLKKENILFPLMEKYGISGPPKVMWGVDDEIRDEIKQVTALLEEKNETLIKERVEKLLDKVTEMIYKEENIMLPMLTEILTEDEWEHIAAESNEIGFIISNVPVWKPEKRQKENYIIEDIAENDSIQLPSGVFKLNELTAMLNTLPLDITFVDKNDNVKFFSQSKERIFPRTKTIIGRKVTDCHPPASVHIVAKIVEDFKNNVKDHEDFWIKKGDIFVFIRYFAVRDEKGEYLGVVEITQNIKPIQDITGEKRLMS